MSVIGARRGLNNRQIKHLYAAAIRDLEAAAGLAQFQLFDLMFERIDMRAQRMARIREAIEVRPSARVVLDELKRGSR